MERKYGQLNISKVDQMKRVIQFLSLILIVAAFACTNAKVKPAEQKVTTDIPRPNIIMILCDDLGYADVGFNGSKEITTPHLDKLAGNGTVCSSAYVPHPFCGPSRAGIMTGRYPHKFGSQFNVPVNSGDIGGEGIPLKETFISNVLQNAGYYTGAVGKWHLGGVPKYHPNVRGFDDYYGFLGGGHDYFPERYRPIYEQRLKEGRKVIGDYVKPLEHNGKEVRETEYITDALSREATRFVNDAAQKEAPFFLYLAYNAPHSPLQAKEEDLAKFDHITDEKRKTYAAMVYAVDRGIGRLVQALENNNELDNTLIIFFSDNGGKLKLGATNTPLREGKGSTCEGGYRIPMFLHWPNALPKGRRFEHPLSALDFYPTLCKLTQAKVPTEKELDGKDIWNDLIEGSAPHKGEMIYAMRHRSGYTDIGARMDNWKILKTNQNNWHLFDIENDLGELNDLSSQHPDRLKAMVSQVENWSQSHTEPLWYNPANIAQDWEEKEMGKFKTTFKIGE